ncbi:MAG: trypsin-like serine protease [Bdellovibrionaceae bacterium]|nr:trypsin-like serine protease [Pseudobdellovibrionaceae bacterium]
MSARNKWLSLSLVVIGFAALLSGPRPETSRHIASLLRMDLPAPKNPNLHQAIYNGNDLAQEPLGHFPRFLVLIESVTAAGQTSYCTGTAIAPDVVLTAGHCVVGMESLNVKVITNNDPLEFQTIPARAWKHHPQYNGGREGRMLGEFNEQNAHEYKDLGLIVMSSPSSHVEPAALAPRDFDPATQEAWLFVFGPTRDSQYRITGGLSFADVQRPRVIGSSKLYVAPVKSGQGWCVRDSGGPVTIAAESAQGGQQHYLLGVGFAFFDGFRNGDPADLKKVWGDLNRVPGCGARVGFTLVGSEIGWIESTIEELLPGQPRPLQFY